MSIRDEAELIMAVRDYHCEEREELDSRTDITALDTELNEKILLRIVKSKSESGFIGIDAVRKMNEALASGDYDKGFLFGKKFTDAALHEMAQNGIKTVSIDRMLQFMPDRLYVRIHHFVDRLCKADCGRVPKSESDCREDCGIRIISDNASFHFEMGWVKLLKNDLKQLLLLQPPGV